MGEGFRVSFSWEGFAGLKKRRREMYTKDEGNQCELKTAAGNGRLVGW